MEILEIVKTLQSYSERVVSYKLDSEFAHAVTEAVDLLIEQGERLADVTDNNVGSKWIPVTEQEEPTENGTYLCHGYWFGSRRKQTESAEFFGEWNIANNFILTHWMPLPEPPKEVE